MLRTKKSKLGILEQFFDTEYCRSSIQNHRGFTPIIFKIEYINTV